MDKSLVARRSSANANEMATKALMKTDMSEQQVAEFKVSCSCRYGVDVAVDVTKHRECGYYCWIQLPLTTNTSFQMKK